MWHSSVLQIICKVYYEDNMVFFQYLKNVTVFFFTFNISIIRNIKNCIVLIYTIIQVYYNVELLYWYAR